MSISNGPSATFGAEWGCDPVNMSMSCAPRVSIGSSWDGAGLLLQHLGEAEGRHSGVVEGGEGWGGGHANRMGA